jgi:hypothetical protein
MTDALRGLGFGDSWHTAKDLGGMAIRTRGLAPMSRGTIRAVLPPRRADPLTETQARLGPEGGDLPRAGHARSRRPAPGCCHPQDRGALPSARAGGNVS